jgi:hypothetical protein
MLIAWMPSCSKTESDPSGDAVVITEGAPIDGSPLGSPAGVPPPDTQLQPDPAPESGSDIPQTPSQVTATDSVASASGSAPGAQPVSFAYLSSFEYNVPDPFAMKGMKEEELKNLSAQIPDYIKNLNKKKVALKGFMVPIDVEGEGVKSFILTYSRMMCCFGQMPWYNEWVYVEMPSGQKAKFFNDVPITVSGALEVGEEIEDGFVISLYRMKGETVAAAPEPPNSGQGANN